MPSPIKYELSDACSTKGMARCQKKEYQVNRLGMREKMTVCLSDGSDIEFMMRCTFAQLEEVREAVDIAWTGPQRFRQLHNCLFGEALQQFDDLVLEDYSTDNQKTHANYKLIKKDLITALSDKTPIGNDVRRYLENDINYEDCKDPTNTNRPVKPTKHLARMTQLRQLGSEMHNTYGDTLEGFFPAQTFKMTFYNTFPEKMTLWMENTPGNPDPFSDTVDAQDIADTMQNYWNIHYDGVKKPSEDGNGEKKKSNYKDDSNDRKRNERDDSDDDDDDDDSDGESGSRPSKKHQGGRDRGGGDRNDRNNSSYKPTRNCLINGHEKHYHDYERCFLNPDHYKFDEAAAKEFYETNATGPNKWYKAVYEAFRNNSSRSNGGRYSNNGNYRGGYQGRGGGNQGHGNYQGRGNGGRGYDNNQSSHQNQSAQQGGYHYQEQYDQDEYDYQQQYAPPSQYHSAPIQGGFSQAAPRPQQGTYYARGNYSARGSGTQFRF